MIQKCLHGKTQNANECFNRMILEQLPKKQYVELVKLKLGVSDSTANFNDGKKASIGIMTKMNLVPGKFMRAICDTENKKRKSLYTRHHIIPKQAKNY